GHTRWKDRRGYSRLKAKAVANYFIEEKSISEFKIDTMSKGNKVRVYRNGRRRTVDGVKIVLDGIEN
ncbi:hypothetical protein ACFL20_10430, partial [Spirochaetota bacterium]